jgi:hypothetical protein
MAAHPAPTHEPIPAAEVPLLAIFTWMLARMIGPEG